MSLPVAGELYLDSNALIYLVEDVPSYNAVLQPFWAAVMARQASAVTSTLSLLEATVRPFREGNTPLVDAYRKLLTDTEGIGILPLTLPILESAARLRASHPSLRTPDALHAASALALGVDGFVTNDGVFRTVLPMPVFYLRDFVP